MASVLFVCRSCLGNHRLENKVVAPDDFDYLCEDCRAKAAHKPRDLPARKK